MAGIINGQNANADEVLNAIASNTVDSMQNLFNVDYLGFDPRLANSGVPSLKNVFYSTFTSDDANLVAGFDYDATNDLYKTIDFSSIGTEYIIIEADDDNITWTNNDTKLAKLDSGKWILYGTSADTDAVKRAKIIKSLFYGTSGSNQLILDFTNVTEVKTSHTNDVGKRGLYAKLNSSANNAVDYSGVFSDTSNNTNCSSWSKLRVTNASVGTTNHTLLWEIPTGTVRNTASRTSSAGTTTVDELGTDTSSDENDNPSNCTTYKNVHTGSGSDSLQSDIVLLADSIISWTLTGGTGATGTEIDFKVDNSIPDMTAAGSLATEGINDATLIFKDTATETVTNAIPVINSQIDAISSEQISISADGGSNFTDVENAKIARPTSGTALWRKIVITRTDLSKEDKITEQAVKYNFY